MSGGTIAACQACGRLTIYGQVCTCGHHTSRPLRDVRPTTEEA